MMNKNRLHNNSQKRFYNPNHIYFITSVVDQRMNFFKEDIFCKLFIRNIFHCKKIKKFYLFGFTIMHDHVHLLIMSNGKFNISEIMFSIKKQFSHNANRVIGYNRFNFNRKESVQDEGEQALARLQMECMLDYDKYVFNLHKAFHQKYKHKINDTPSFKRQKSFHDHVIRDEEDFINHLNYIALNCIKHNICNDEIKYKWSFLNPRFEKLIDDYFE